MTSEARTGDAMDIVRVYLTNTQKLITNEKHKEIT